MNGSPTWKMTKLMSGKFAAAPSMSQVWVASTGWGPSGTPLCTPMRFTPSSWAFSNTGKAIFGSSIRHGKGVLRAAHPQREGGAVVVADVVELERLRAELADLALHEVQRPAALQRVD